MAEPAPLSVDPERLFAKIGLLTVQVELLQEQLAALAEQAEEPAP